MSATTSAATGRCFGIQRVCQVWERSRSALYARRGRAHHHRRGGDRCRGHRTRSCWRRFVPISLGPRSTAKAIARSTHGFGSWTGSASPARGCCASCGRTDCSPRTAGVRAPRRPTTGGSSPRRPTCCGGRTACGYSRSTTGGAGSSRQSNTGTRSAWGGTCAKSGAASRHSIRLRKGSNGSMARWTPTSPAGWRFCQGRSKIRPRWRRKTRPPGRWAECLSAVVRTGWSGVWDRPWGGLRRSGNPCAQPAPSWGGRRQGAGEAAWGGPSCCVRGGSCRR